MIGIVYFCRGKVMGYSLPVRYIQNETVSEKSFFRDMILEGARMQNNVIVDGAYWSAMVFNEAGEPLWQFDTRQASHHQLKQVHVEGSKQCPASA